MTIPISKIIDILEKQSDDASETNTATDSPSSNQVSSDIGEVNENETIYTTSITEVFRDEENAESDGLNNEDPRIQEWRKALWNIIQNGTPVWQHKPCETPLEPHCAWYCPIHYFGYGWGIYIREECILSHALEIARFVDWDRVQLSNGLIAKQLLRSAFYIFFLHEQFHHKVESLGLRLLISTGTDRYRAYKSRVYRATYGTADCLEESLANAESYRRLSEARYKKRIDPIILRGMRRYLQASMRMQPPGYAEGLLYLTESKYRTGLHELQSRILDGVMPPTTPAGNWVVAPDMITSLANISSDIYVVIPVGARPIFRPTTVDPGATVSSRELEKALTRHHGYQHVPGGKGSHVKLKKTGSPTITLPGDRPVLSPGVVKQALSAVGGFPISRLPDLLEGRLSRI